MKKLGIATALVASLACGGVPDVPPAVVRLIPEEPRETLQAKALGVEVPVLDSSFGASAWLPGAAGRWRLEDGALVIEPGGKPFDLEREVAINASQLQTVEATLASRHKIRLSLSWIGEEKSWVEQPLTLAYADGRGEPHRKTFTFDLRSHAEWSGTISRLRLRLETTRSDERIAVQSLRGLRQELTLESLAEQSRRPWKVELDREVRDALVVPPGHPVVREVSVPTEAVLRFALGTTGRLSMPIDFRIVAERPAGGNSTLFETRLEPIARGAPRQWRPARVDLGALAGEQVRLRVESIAGDGYDPALGVPVWANPEIVASGESPRPNIVLISIDTLRADRLSLYGYERTTSPHIDAWARRHATVFRQAVAQAPWTLPSHASMLTGLDALHHGVNHPFRAAPESLTTLAERLRDEGYFTAAINGGAWLHPHYGLAQGFERYRTWSGEQRGDRELEAHAALASRWLADLRKPFFLFLHTFDVHDFNAPHRREKSASQSLGSEPSASELYDRAVSHMDDQIDGFLDAVSELRRQGQTLLVLTSDHGEDLGEDGVSGHGSLREQVLRIPLVVESPGGLGAGKFLDDQVRSIDLVPTLLDLAGLGVPSGLDGVSLRGLIEGEAMTVPSLATSYFALDHGVSLRVQNRWKYVYDPSAWAPDDGASSRSMAREALYQLPGGESPRRDNLAPDHRLAGRFRTLARRLLEERLAGLRLSVDNALQSPFIATLRGDLVRSGVPKTIDPPVLLTRVAESAASFSLPPERHLQLLFERVGEPRFELVVAPFGDEPGVEDRRLAIDLETVALPASFLWSGSSWRVVGEAPSSAVTVTVEWHRVDQPEGAVPFEQDPELRQQLETLGYLD